ncbi:transcription antitermination factor NusB [Candidatus Neptunochlamydia vexilliferae]|uniref:transcription antitermination factor NusB n=1 Tax=Candidatus Neptunichlamydia vexilliferae TaxID=1651774 RepID=UPI0018917C96|nr:transcription antitermination factor NusB [Candidatus Neptunochlamydia vexilliferae]
MVASQRKFREIVFQTLYSRDLNEEADAKVLSSFLDQFVVTRKVLHQAYAKVEKIFSDLEAIDALISKFSKDYDFKRISRVERNILRLGVYELKMEGEIPPKVAIAEAIRLSRKFGTPEGGAFVNAVLDAIFQSEEAPCLSKPVLNPTSP